MNKNISVTVLLTVCLTSAALAAEPQETAPSPVASVTVDVLSAYVWRGLTFNDGMVVQPALDAQHPSGLGFNVWGNFDVDDYNGNVEKREFSEVDLTVSYALPLEGPFGVSLGYTEFLFPKEGNYDPEVPGVEPVKDLDTREVWLKLSYSPVDALTLGASVNRDVDESEGLYGDVSLTYSYAFSDALGTEAGVRLGAGDKKFAEAYAGGSEGGLFDWGASLKLSYAVADGFTLGAPLYYTDNIDKDVFPEDSADVNWYGGVTASTSF